MHIGIGIHMGSTGKAAAGGAGVSSPVTGFVQSGANDAGAGVREWTNVSNITADDGSSAVLADTLLGEEDETQYLVGTNPDREAVPDGATITGVEVIVKRRNAAGGTTTVDAEVRLVKGGVISGDNKADAVTAWPASLTAKIYGGDLWGLTLTPADVNAANFGVAIRALGSAGNSQPQVGSIEISVYFTV